MIRCSIPIHFTIQIRVCYTSLVYVTMTNCALFPNKHWAHELKKKKFKHDFYSYFVCAQYVVLFRITFIVIDLVYFIIMNIHKLNDNNLMISANLQIIYD